MHSISTDVYLTIYSTLASTLAGGFGLLVAIVLYVMQSIGTHIGSCAEVVTNGSPANRARLHRYRNSHRWDELIRAHADAGQLNPMLSKEENLLIDEQFHEMRLAVLRLSLIRREFVRAGYLTGTIIMASLTVMPLCVFWLPPVSPFSVLLLAALMVGAMCCIYGYFRLMMAVVPKQ